MRAGKGSMVKRFGARYGARLRKKVQEVELSQRALYPCDRCGSKTVRRIAVGIWECKKCGYKFAGGAWAPVTTVK